MTRGDQSGGSAAVTTITTTSNTQQSSTSTASSNPSSTIGAQSNNEKEHKGFWNNTSAVGGVFAVVGIVGVVLLGLVIFLIWWYCRRKSRNEKLGTGGPVDPTDGGTGGGRHVFATFAGDQSAANQTHGDNSRSPSHMRNSSSAFSDSEMKLVPIFDQRVDPNQLYMRWDQNASATSLQDNQDYSRRVLRVANPNEDNDSIGDAVER